MRAIPSEGPPVVTGEKQQDIHKRCEFTPADRSKVRATASERSSLLRATLSSLFYSQLRILTDERTVKLFLGITFSKVLCYRAEAWQAFVWNACN
jgi:hypothetical protein